MWKYALRTTAGVDPFAPYTDSEDANRNAGLGLFIVKTETEAMAGTATYRADNGSVFVLSLLGEN